jgi:hypothetical protein
MTLKKATFLALAGTLPWTIILTVRLVFDVSGVVRGIVPAIALVSVTIEWVASLGLLVFLAVFHKSQ